MNVNQKLYVGALFGMAAVVVLGSAYLPTAAFLAVFTAAAALVSLIRTRVVPTSPVPSPLQILERSRVWRFVAIGYAAVVVAVVVWHLFVERLAVFDDVPLPVLMLLALGPGLGPMVQHAVITYRMLGSER